jgi:hypothetical protein
LELTTPPELALVDVMLVAVVVVTVGATGEALEYSYDPTSHAALVGLVFTVLAGQFTVWFPVL